MPIQRLVAWYRRYERPISSVSLVGGFVFDILTLRRVDTFWENFFILLHLVAAAVFLLLLGWNSKRADATKRSEWEFWLVNLLQFTYGGLLSAFLVFYFRSASFSVSWPFLFLLALAFFANERLVRFRERLVFQVSLFFISVFSFAIFFIPVVLGTIGPWIFILSGVVSLVLMRWFLAALRRLSGEKFQESKRVIWLTVLGIFAGVNILYFTNILPPIPLSLKDGGIYYSVTKVSAGEYVLQKPAQKLIDYLSLYPRVRLFSHTQTLYAYTAIFSPGKFNTGISHEWQRYNETSGSWVTVSTVRLSISGGREEGYRTYSSTNVVPGKWRVNVLTAGGQVISRIGFTSVY